jgi:signal recognition particle receptor subunit beta
MTPRPQGQYKLVFLGEPGAGKSTCIRSVSDIPAVSTDVATTDELAMTKKTTTVALDYGEMILGDRSRVLLYGLPGQARFRFMFDTVRENLAGAVVLVDASAKAPIIGLSQTLDSYVEALRDVPVVVAINKLRADGPDLRPSVAVILRKYGLVAPVLCVDARNRRDIALIFDLIFICAEHGDA